MIKATVVEVNTAFGAFTRIFEETKLDGKAAWRVARLLGQLKIHVKAFEKGQSKLYKDAGGMVDQRGVSMFVLSGQQKDENLEDWVKRRDAYRDKTNTLHEQIDAMLDEAVEINYDAIPLSLLPKERKNDKGDKEPVEYRATDLANAGPFLIDDTPEPK